MLAVRVRGATDPQPCLLEMEVSHHPSMLRVELGHPWAKLHHGPAESKLSSSLKWERAPSHTTESDGGGKCLISVSGLHIHHSRSDMWPHTYHIHVNMHTHFHTYTNTIYHISYKKDNVSLLNNFTPRQHTIHLKLKNMQRVSS